MSLFWLALITTLIDTDRSDASCCEFVRYFGNANSMLGNRLFTLDVGNFGIKQPKFDDCSKQIHLICSQFDDVECTLYIICRVDDSLLFNSIGIESENQYKRIKVLFVMLFQISFFVIKSNILFVHFL